MTDHRENCFTCNRITVGIKNSPQEKIPREIANTKVRVTANIVQGYKGTKLIRPRRSESKSS